MVAPTDVRARTSARLHGRARDGLADLLLGLVHDTPRRRLGPLAGGVDRVRDGQRRCAPSAAAATNPAGAR